MSFKTPIVPVGTCRRIPTASHDHTQPSKMRKNVVSRGRFFLAAVSFLILRLSLTTTIALIGWVLVQNGEIQREILIAFGISAALLVLSSIHVISNGRKVTCPLCRASLFMSSRNLVKPGVRKILGCSKTPLAFSLLTMPEVLSCPCCAEKVRLTRSS